MYQYIQVLIYVFFRKEIKWGQVPYTLRELLNKYLSWSRSQAKVTAPAPDKYLGSGRLWLRNPGGWAGSLSLQNQSIRRRVLMGFLQATDRF